jgi:hypothetical protein
MTPVNSIPNTLPGGLDPLDDPMPPRAVGACARPMDGQRGRRQAAAEGNGAPRAGEVPR